VGKCTSNVSGEGESIFVIWLELADSVDEIRGNVRVHDEMQDGGAVAAAHVGVGVRCEARLLRIYNVEVIAVVIHASASLSLDGVAFFWINGQMQRDNAVATEHGLQRVRIEAGNRN